MTFDTLHLAIMYLMAYNPTCKIIFIVCLMVVHFVTQFSRTYCNRNGEYLKSFKCGVWMERSVCPVENHHVTDLLCGIHPIGTALGANAISVSQSVIAPRDL